MKILLLIVSCLIIIMTAIQTTEKSGLSQLLSQNISLFDSKKERGVEKILSITTLICVVMFFVLVILINLGESL